MAKSNSTARERGPACPMADATLPQTKYAQNLKPYEGELPSYIRAMDEYASRVGLTIRHLRDRDYIVLVYSGTREQIGAFGLSQEESIRWPSGAKVSSKVSLYKVSPCGYPNHGCIFKINEERYAIQIKEPTPRSISTVGDSIECFDFNDGTPWGYVAYVGEKDKLISEGIAGADLFPDDSADEGGKEKTAPNASGYQLVLEETTRLHGGKWAYLKYPHHIEEAEEVKRQAAEGKLSSYKTPEEYRQHLLKAVDFAFTFVGLGPLETKTGRIYTIDAESREAIEDARGELYWAIHDAVIHTRMVPVKLSEEEKTAKRDQYADAQSDAAFKVFVQGLIGNQDVH